jgi:hypothetical protein
MTKNYLIRLEPSLVYGSALPLVEILGDRVGLSISDIHDVMIAFVEYCWFNDGHTLNPRAFVDTYFMGDTMGYDVLYAVQSQLPEIASYIPFEISSVKYLRTYNGGFYILSTHEQCSTNLRRYEVIETHLT